APRASESHLDRAGPPTPQPSAPAPTSLQNFPMLVLLDLVGQLRSNCVGSSARLLATRPGSLRPKPAGSGAGIPAALLVAPGAIRGGYDSSAAPCRQTSGRCSPSHTTSCTTGPPPCG